MRDADLMRERLPKVGECLAAGDINYAMFNVIAHQKPAAVAANYR